MLNLRSALKNDSICKSLTGLTVKEFKDLVPELEKAFMDNVNSKPREREYGGGSKSAISTFEDKLFFILFYVKCYPTFAVCGFFYDRHRTKCQVWEKELLPILEKALGRKCSLPKREITSCEDFIKSFPKIKEIFIDGTERKVQRPKEQESQKNHYSGKKKTHTKKNLVVVNSKKKYLH